MTIYAMIFCFTASALGPGANCNLFSRQTFTSLQECHQTLSRILGGPLDKDGRLLKDSNDWWQCASKHIDTWEAK